MMPVLRVIRDIVLWPFRRVRDFVRGFLDGVRDGGSGTAGSGDGIDGKGDDK
jgi:hypothetical protein